MIRTDKVTQNLIAREQLSTLTGVNKDPEYRTREKVPFTKMKEMSCFWGRRRCHLNKRRERGKEVMNDLATPTVYQIELRNIQQKEASFVLL